MGGGLLQLVAHGVEDLFITGEPQITLFKTVYRRHSHFSIEDKVLKFNSRPKFGGEMICKARYYGDLIHKLYLLIDLPEINLFFIVLTKSTTKNLLSTYGITWNFTGNSGDTITNDDIIEIETLINAKIDEIVDNIELIDMSLNTLINTDELQPDDVSNENLSTDDYFNKLIGVLIQFDKMEFIYAFTQAWKNDYVINSTNESFVNSSELQDLLIQKYIEDGRIIVNDGDVNIRLDENYIFVSNLEFNNYSLGINEIGISGQNFFQNKLDIIYSDTSYQILDAYQLFIDYFDNNNIILNNDTDVSSTLDEVLSVIKNGLVRNVELLERLYDIQTNKIRFTFYKNYPISGTSFSATGSFENLSINNPADTSTLYDNFSDKFTVAQSNDPAHSFETYVQSTISPYNILNRDVFRTTIFQGYFDDVINEPNMWSDIKISNLVNDSDITKVPNTTIENIFLLNAVPFATAVDIPDAVDYYIEEAMGSSFATFQSEMSTALESARDDIHTEISQYICTNSVSTTQSVTQHSDEDALEEYITSFSASTNRDLIGFFTYIHYYEVDGINYNIAEYVVRRMLFEANNVISSYSGSPTLPQANIDKIIELINTFITPIENIPTYSNYVANGYTLFDTGVVPNPFIAESGSLVPRFGDAMSSIWIHIYNTLVDNFNNLYNNQILLDSYISSLGYEMSRYKDRIDPEFSSWTTGSIVDYYSANSIIDNVSPSQFQVGDISTGAVFIANEESSAVSTQSASYEANKELLDARNITVPRQLYFFEMITGNRTLSSTESTNDLSEIGTLDFIEAEIISRLGGLSGTIQDIMDDARTNIEDANIIGVMDKYDYETTRDIDDINFQKAFEDFFSLTTPGYDPGSQLLDLWNNRAPKIGSSMPIIENIERDNYIATVGDLTPKKLYSDLSNISNNFSTLATEVDFTNYMLDLIIRSSDLNPLLSQKGLTNEETHTNFVAYYNEIRNTFTNLLMEILGYDYYNPPDPLPEIALLELINSRREIEKRASFAWVKKVGLFMIEYIKVVVGGQTIDCQTGEWMMIKHTLNKIESKERGYNIMIGDIERIYSYNDQGKKGMRLYVPCEFWFCSDVGRALPIVSLTKTDVEFIVKLRSLDKCAYWQSDTYFNPIPKPELNIMAQYIFLEPEERKMFATSKHEYLIEQIQFTKGKNIQASNFNDNRIRSRLYFKHTCKELVWILRDKSNLDGSNTNGELIYEDFYRSNSMKYNIYFNGIERQPELDADFFSLLQKYTYHTAIINDGITVYSFSLNPEKMQPSGSINMGKLNNSDIVLHADQAFIDLLETRVLEWNIYGVGQNIFRVMSGMGALAFYE